MVRNRKVELSTVIGKDCKFTGTIQVKGGLRIDGEVEGSIDTDGFVTIGASGVVHSSIVAEECLVSGKVKGDISVKSAVELDKTSNMKGNIKAKILKIHSGAIFNGSSKMEEEENAEGFEAELETE